MSCLSVNGSVGAHLDTDGSEQGLSEVARLTVQPKPHLFMTQRHKELWFDLVCRANWEQVMMS